MTGPDGDAAPAASAARKTCCQPGTRRSLSMEPSAKRNRSGAEVTCLDPATAYGDSSVGSTTTCAPQRAARARRPAERSEATIVRTPRALSQQITARPTGPQPSTIATSRREIDGLVDRVQRDRHRLGEHGDVGGQPVGHHERHRLLDQHLLGVAAGRQRRQPDRVGVAPAADQRERHDVRALAELAARAATPLAHLAHELVAHDGGRRGPHELVVVELLHHLGQPVAVLAGVQVGAADPAAQHAEHQLPLVGARVRQLDHRQLGVLTRDGSHRVAPSCSNACTDSSV